MAIARVSHARPSVPRAPMATGVATAQQAHALLARTRTRPQIARLSHFAMHAHSTRRQLTTQVVLASSRVLTSSRLRRFYHSIVDAPSSARRCIIVCAMRAWNHPCIARLRVASATTTLPVKAKLLLGFALVVAQIGDVYQIRYPEGYQSITHKLFAPLRLQLFDWIPGFDLRCFGIATLEAEILLYSLVPLALVVVALAVAWLRHRSLVPALPFVLRLAYLLFPSVSSKGFQTLGECDCFKQIDGGRLCFLPTDYAVECQDDRAPPHLLALGAVAVGIFGVGVPFLYACLLYSCRVAIRREADTPLSTALNFLHGSLHPWALFWPLVEASRALLLTGFLALVTPGHIFQLLCGLLVAIAFLVLQIWIAPYRTASNNFFAMLVNVSLVLDFVSSIGIQVNSEYGGDIKEWLLSVALWTSAFAVFPLTLLSLLSALRQRVTPAQLRAYLLGEDDIDSSDGTGADGAPLPLVARFGEFSINAADVDRALNAPLLTGDELKTLQSIAIRKAQLASRTSAKYTADAADLLLSEPGEAARGVAHHLGVPYLELLTRMGRGVQAITDEFESHGTDDDKRWLHYVLHEPAAHHEGLQDPERAGVHLAYFVAHPKTRAAGLEEVHVVALRLYTSTAFASLNDPLRQSTGGAHPFAVTVAFVAEGIKRLRAVDAGARAPLRLWRGLCNVRGDIPRTGGTEPAMLSCTPDLEMAARFATSRQALLFLVTAKTFMQRGASLDFLSCFPQECEVCFPPCTYLKPTGRAQSVELPGELRCVVVEVTPHIGS